MAITTLDGIAAGLLRPYPFLKVGVATEAAGVWHTFAYQTGLPGAMAAPSSAIAGTAITSRSGLVSVPAPAGANLSYLAKLELNASVTGQLILADRLWDNATIVVTTTTAQTVTSAAFPARDRNGATSGEGVFVGIEVSAATTNAGAVTTITLSYTNSAGTSGRTATMTSFPATAVAGTFVPFQLQAGDLGVQSIQSITLGTSLVTGNVHLVAYRELARASVAVPNVGVTLDAIALGFTRLWDNTTVFPLWIPTATTANTISGALAFAQG